MLHVRVAGAHAAAAAAAAVVVAQTEADELKRQHVEAHNQSSERRERGREKPRSARHGQSFLTPSGGFSAPLPASRGITASGLTCRVRHGATPGVGPAARAA
ncbi:unnamed protein product [Ectocarpus fasciculatus]